MADDHAAAPTTTAEAPQNLIDAAAPGAATAGAAVPAKVVADPAAAANTEWFWTDGVKGADKRPDWLKADKYKTVADQAKAYIDLEKKHGELAAKFKDFAGAPEKYDLTVPEDLKDKLEWLPDDPLLAQFQTLAKESGMSQPIFEKLLHTFAQYEYANMAPDWAKEKAAIGERADERLSGFWDWAGATFDDETATTVKRALGVAPSPAEIFKALEAVQNAGRQPAVFKPGDDVAGGAMSVEALNSKYRTPDATTKRALIDTPDGLKAYRAELAKLVGTGDHKVIVGAKKQA